MPMSSYVRLSQLADLLGWPELHSHRHADTTWYESGLSEGGRSDLFLQFNHAPNGEHGFFGAVYAIRYRICTGWHQFTLATVDGSLDGMASELDCWLHHRWFATPKMRRTFRKLHPECASYSWRRIRDEGPPYHQA
jgi:hypothetical protein